MTTTDTGPQTEARRGGVAADDLRAAIANHSRGRYSMLANLDVALETAYGAGIAEARRLTVERLREALIEEGLLRDDPESPANQAYNDQASERIAEAALAQEETRA